MLDFTSFIPQQEAKPKFRGDDSKPLLMTISSDESASIVLVDKATKEELIRVTCKRAKIDVNLSAIYKLYKRKTIQIEYK